jgi:hypothetical protein
MPQEQRSRRGPITVQHIFNTATVTVGGLYLSTHSVVVTITGTIAATALTGWSIWVSSRRESGR